MFIPWYSADLDSFINIQPHTYTHTHTFPVRLSMAVILAAVISVDWSWNGELEPGGELDFSEKA